MLDHATAPKHLYLMANDPKNAVFLVGYQSPSSVGAKVQSGERKIEIPWEERGPDGFRREMRETEIKLSVEKVSGFSSHARGQQILEWLAGFKSIGEVCVVHGEAEKAKGLADAISKMGIKAVAPIRDYTVTPSGDRVKPGPVPPLAAPKQPQGLDPVDK
jgi:predicted metal-dependent RNase